MVFQFARAPAEFLSLLHSYGTGSRGDSNCHIELPHKQGDG